MLVQKNTKNTSLIKKLEKKIKARSILPYIQKNPIKTEEIQLFYSLCRHLIANLMFAERISTEELHVINAILYSWGETAGEMAAFQDTGNSAMIQNYYKNEGFLMIDGWGFVKLHPADRVNKENLLAEKTK